MNSFCTKVVPFAMMQPGKLLRIEVKRDIYFEALNQRTCHTVFPRIALGLDISKNLDGYWGTDVQGRFRRLSTLESRQALLFDREPLNVIVDLGVMKFQEVYEFHQMLTGLHLPFTHKALT